MKEKSTEGIELREKYPDAKGDLDNPKIQKAVKAGHFGALNITPFTSEKAKVAQSRSAAKRTANHLMRKELKLTAEQFNEFKREVLPELEVDAVDFLRLLLLKAMNRGDEDTAADLAKSIAEYDRPKLARVETNNRSIDYTKASDEDMKALAAGTITEDEFMERLGSKNE